MRTLLIHHLTVVAMVLVAVATAVTYDLGMYPYAVWNAFLTGGFAVLTVWSFALEHGLRLPTTARRPRDS